MSGEAAIEVRDLVRDFGDVQAVRGISFDVPAGHVVGFVGANGAGKTTTMRIMVTLDQPTSGSVRVAGYDAVDRPDVLRRRVGWMPDAYGAYPNVTVAEYLDFMARAFGFAGVERRRRVEEVTAFTELSDLADRDMKALSKGQSQRLCLARALVNDPEVLVLDEPAAGLDPRARAEFKRLVRVLAEDGKTVFISSHILSELGEMCDGLLFLDEGRVVYEGPAAGLTRPGETTRSSVRVEVAGDPQGLLTWADVAAGVEVIEALPDGARLAIEGGRERLAGALRRMVLDGIEVLAFTPEQVRLEDAFIGLLDEVRAGR